MCIYNTGSRTGQIDSLREMRSELSPEETELRDVYKRQVRALRMTPAQLNAMLSGGMNHGRDTACLLYTSRCV